MDRDPILERFLAALDLPESERAAYLDRVCGSNSAMRAEIEALLAYERRFDPERLDAAIEAVATTLARDEESWTGRVLGAYRITGQIGAGGMGAVFLAERADARFEKKVAIKLVTRGLDSAQIRQRLIEERRILAHLDHPYIAKLLDGGETEEGVPYLVMEYVAGRPLLSFSSGLALRERVELTGRICEAVAFAHRNLVVHRDLKPSNILVTEDGTPKLLDFGIAGALHAVDMVRAYTPKYAAPEVVAGQPVSTAADIYSLGVILREMVGAGPEDLEAVIGKALADLPGDRYFSASDLGADLERWRTGYPVEARRSSVMYRGRLFVRRNRWLVMGAAAALLGVAVSTGAALWQARRASEALELAQVAQWRSEQEARQAEASRQTAVRERESSANRLQRLVTMASTTLTEIHDTLERVPGSTVERRKIVDETLRLLEREQAEGGNSPELLETVAEGYRRIGTVLGVPTHPNLGDGKAARQYLHRASELAATLLRKAPDSPSLWKIWISSQDLEAVVLQEQGFAEQGHALLAPVITAARQWTAKHREAIDVIHALSSAEQDDFAAMYGLGGKSAPSPELLHAAIRNLNYVLAHRPDNKDAIKDLASAQSRYAEYQMMSGDAAGGVVTELKVASLREALLRQAPDDVIVLRDLMIAYSKLGDFQGSVVSGAHLGDPAKAYFYYRKTIALADRIAALDPSDQNGRYDAAMAVLHAGMIEPEAAQTGESIAFLSSAVERFGPLRELGPQYAAGLANAYEFLARRRAPQGDKTGAAEAARKSLEVAQEAARRNAGNKRVSIQLLYSYLVAIPLAGASMTEAERDELLRKARADFAVAIQGNERMRHYPARLAEAEGDLKAALGASACASYEESLRIWESLPANKDFEKEMMGVRGKRERCR